MMRASRLGDDIDDFCVKCKRVMNHAVVSLLNDAPAKVRCRTCHSDHDFRNEQPPPPKVDPRKAALFNQVLENAEADPADPRPAADAPAEVAAEGLSRRMRSAVGAALPRPPKRRAARKPEPDDDLRHRRRRLHRFGVHSPGIRGRASHRQLRQADLRGQSREPGFGRRKSRLLAGSRAMSASPREVAEGLPEHCDAVVHFAAESHVDRSILERRGIRPHQRARHAGHAGCGPASARRALPAYFDRRSGGDMEPDEWFREDSPLEPNSPYAASKTAAEHFVRAAAHTFGLDTWSRAPAIITGRTSSPRSCCRWRFRTRSKTGRSRFMAMACRCATGFMWRTTAGRCSTFWSAARAGRRITLAAEIRSRISKCFICC